VISAAPRPVAPAAPPERPGAAPPWEPAREDGSGKGLILALVGVLLVALVFVVLVIALG
jgi:hypothetical protein